jgi:hypothetical protein
VYIPRPQPYPSTLQSRSQPIHTPPQMGWVARSAGSCVCVCVYGQQLSSHTVSSQLLRSPLFRRSRHGDFTYFDRTFTKHVANYQIHIPYFQERHSFTNKTNLTGRQLVAKGLHNHSNRKSVFSKSCVTNFNNSIYKLDEISTHS